jgi:hypothetical protein
MGKLSKKSKEFIQVPDVNNSKGLTFFSVFQFLRPAFKQQMFPEHLCLR